jgi:hypothetical protein
MTGYNRGDRYENEIFEILTAKNLVAIDTKRGGAGNLADIQILYNSQIVNLEVKADTEADYGQKMLKWENGIWSWCVDDITTQFYTQIGILDIIHNKQFTPNKHSINNKELTVELKKEDQNNFESTSSININALYDYYASKNCFYIQIGGHGFYHLKKDLFNLGTQQLICDMKLRLRAKTIHSDPVHNYGFYAVLKVDGKPTKSMHDIEEKEGRVFPF